MNNLNEQISKYLEYCQYQKRLDEKTLKAYRIDLRQFTEQIPPTDIPNISQAILEDYIVYLHQNYKPKTVKRKIASVKALFHYLEYRKVIEKNPFYKMQIKFREPVILPKIIPLHTLEVFLKTIYKQCNDGKTNYQRRNALRDAAIAELLFSTGIRISELCSLGMNDVNLYDRTILIYGKGSKERRIQIGNDDVISILNKYEKEFLSEIHSCKHFFVNQAGRALSDQTVRRMINKYSSLAAIELHITPHMFRHPYVKHTTKIFSLRLMDFQAQAYPDARRKTRGACQLLRVGQSRSPVRPLCNRKRFSCLPPQSKMSWILYAISMRLSGYTSTRSISSSASSVVSVSASKIALDASMRLSCRACSSCFCFACANTAA